MYSTHGGSVCVRCMHVCVLLLVVISCTTMGNALEFYVYSDRFEKKEQSEFAWFGLK